MIRIIRLTWVFFFMIGLQWPFSTCAEKDLGKLILGHSDELLAEYRTAMGFYWSDDYESAGLSFQRIIESYPKYTSAYVYLADCQKALGKTEAAFENYEKAYLLLKEKSDLKKAIVSDAKEPEIYSDMVYCLNAMGRYDNAKKIAMFGSLSGESADLYINMAYTFFKLGQFDIAQSNFCKSRDITTPRELENLTYLRLTKLFEDGLQWGFSCPDESAKERKGTNYALIIAIGNYRDPRINPLRYAERDARQLYKVLTDSRTGMFDRRNVTILLNRDATEKNIKFKFDDIVSKAERKEDLLFVFYAGHGFTYPSGTDTYWLTYDTVVGDQEGNRIKSTAFSNLTLATKISSIKANTVIFFVDACFSSGMVNRPRAIRGLESYLGSGKDILIITSSQANQKSIESPRLKNGVFSYFLIKGLSGQADADSDGLVSVEELWLFINSNVSQYARQMGAEQNPRRSGSSRDSVYLSKNPNY
ncbi:MAG: caspase family protein [Thermodesulfobacteriota bacterium]|nr:caspase family protein [Thermodesulfobacteriota bacterium]